MSQAKGQEWSRGVKALSVLLALLVWLSVILERPGEMVLTVPVRLQRVPPGLALVAPPPTEVEVVVSGPQMLLFMLPFHQASCGLDLTGQGPGQVQVSLRECSFDLGPELKVVRVAPASATLVLSRERGGE